MPPTGHRRPVGGQAAAHPRRNGRPSPPGPHARLADRLIAADKDFELLIVPGAEHTFIDCLVYVRKRCWDFLVRELRGTQPPAYRPAPIAIDPQLLGAACLKRHHIRGPGKPSPPAITAIGLRKSFSDKVVLDGINLHVPEGRSVA